MEEDKQQIDRIYELIMNIAAGNLNFRAPTSGKNDELDAISMGINMLAEELQATTVSKDYLGRIYKGVVDMLIVLNPDDTIQEVNSTLTKVLGYSRDELINTPFSNLLFRNDPKFMNRIDRELKKKGYCHDIERVFKTKKGKNITVSLSCSQLYDKEELVTGILYIAKDISKLKRTEEQLRVKNDELNTFIYRTSHDLKGPLASILGLVHLAKSEVDDIESVNHYISLIEQSAKRLDVILNDFLELGRLTQSQIRSSAVSFEVIISEILKSLEYLPEYKNVDFNLNINSPKAFKSKKILIKAILQNLIENAVKYRQPDEPKTVVTINVSQPDTDEVLISVSDNGIGMSKTTQEHIFKMFYRGYDKTPGSGLGLYIVKTSVDALKGRIEVKSKLNKGSTFNIYLPNRA